MTDVFAQQASRREHRRAITSRVVVVSCGRRLRQAFAGLCGRRGLRRSKFDVCMTAAIVFMIRDVASWPLNCFHGTSALWHFRGSPTVCNNINHSTTGDDTDNGEVRKNVRRRYVSCRGSHVHATTTCFTHEISINLSLC